MPDRVEPLPDWLRRSIRAIGDAYGRDGIALAEAETLRHLLAMAELDDLPAPTIAGTRAAGITAVWTSGPKQFAVHVVADRVEFSSWRDGRRQQIPPAYLRIGRAGLIRERLCWLFGYEKYPCRRDDILAAAGGGPAR